MRSIQTIDQVHIHPGEDGMGWSDERFSNNWPSSRTFWRQMKRMGWENQKRGLHTINQVYIQAEDRWRGWDGMGWSDERFLNNSIDQVHVQTGDGWNGMIRWQVFKQLTRFTYELETDEDGMGWLVERCSHNWQVHVRSGGGWVGLGWSDKRPSNNWPSSRTNWWRMKGMERGNQMSNTQINNWPGSRTPLRGWDGMIRWEIFKQLTKFTYKLEMDEEDGMIR